MSDWSLWFGAAGLLVILELVSGTFYLLMIAIGIACGGVVGLLGGGGSLQMLAAALVGVLAVAALHRSKFGYRARHVNAARDPGVNLDIGQSIHVPQWQDGMARVMYRGALWDVELAPGGAPEPGQFTIREVRGSRLIVAA